ncbi:MAG: class I SAM-dependent methyltransferase [Planctomycetota bacterium]|nr:class I SAM-dependent methyltransferase [Planctomycetota bacterium]
MDRRRWRHLARDFDRDVTDTPRNDARGVIRRAVEEAAGQRRDRVLVDLGCGPATLIRRHASLFARAVGVDFADPVIALARKRCARVPQAELHCVDVALAGEQWPRTADVLACMNVVTSTSARKREAVGRALAAVARPGARLLLVVPALESVQHVHACCQTRNYESIAPPRNGLVSRGGDKQKFWTEGELREALERWGFSTPRLDKVSVPWSDEGVAAGDMRGLPGPWDWLAVARRAR